jgi:hypothetical protein
LQGALKIFFIEKILYKSIFGGSSDGASSAVGRRSHSAFLVKFLFKVNISHPHSKNQRDTASIICQVLGHLMVLEGK